VDLQKIQEMQLEFTKKMQWERFNPTQVFTHLIEELGEVGKHLLYIERYKVKGAGHHGTDSELKTEFAQCLNLFLQLANMVGVDLESAWFEEHELNNKRFDENVWAELAKEDDNKE
jgi:NTP pyrophosphatase (non-canonical NTP hydrolase)